MLWMFDIPQIQLLIGLWMTLMVYAAIATIFSRLNFLVKVIVIPFIFVVAYQSLIVSDILVGHPSYSESETQGMLNGYVVFEKNGGKEIAVLLNTQDGPMLYAVPYNPDTEKNLSQAMTKLTQKGVPTLVRKKGNLSMEGSDGESDGEGQEGQEGQNGSAKSGKRGGKFGTQAEGPLEFYDFMDQYLVPKNPN